MTDFQKIIYTSDRLKAEYGNARPEEIIRSLGIGYLTFEMGDAGTGMKGFIQRNNRCTTIAINSALSDCGQIVTGFHELGHYLLRHLDQLRTAFLGDTSFAYRQNRALRDTMENETNYFTATTILDAEECLELLREYSMDTAAGILNVPVEFLDYELRLLHHTGRCKAYRDFVSVKSDCMKTMHLGSSDGYIA